MKKYISIFILIALFFSCKNEEEKLRVVEKILKSPGMFETILAKDSSFQDDLFVQKYFADDSVKNEFLKKFQYELNKYIGKKYELYCSREVDKFIGQADSREYTHEIVIKGKSDIMLKFIWVLRYGKWHFFDLEFTGSVYCE